MDRWFIGKAVLNEGSEAPFEGIERGDGIDFSRKDIPEFRTSDCE